MIYSRADVERMLEAIRNDLRPKMFYYKNDSVPPQVVKVSDVERALSKIEGTL